MASHGRCHRRECAAVAPNALRDRTFDLGERPSHRRWPSGKPRSCAFCRSAPAVRFMALAIFLTGDLLRECALSSRTSSFDQGRRLVRRARLVAIKSLPSTMRSRSIPERRIPPDIDRKVRVPRLDQFGDAPEFRPRKAGRGPARKKPAHRPTPITRNARLLQAAVQSQPQKRHATSR